jgi:hypothetical protein
MAAIKTANDARSLLLNLNGLAVALSMITTGSLYRAHGTNALANEFVWLTGAFLTFYLSLLYLPVHISVDTLVSEFVHKAQPLDPDASDLDAVHTRRKALAEEIGFKSDLRQNLGSALALAAPFTGAAIAAILKGT